MATIIQFPNSISFLENLKAVRIASSETVAFKLSSGGSTILEETYSPGPSGIVEVELRDVISEYLAIAYPSSNVFNQASAIAQMTVNVDDDEDQDFTVLSGGVRGLSTTDESFLRANWLTWQPQTKIVRWNQPEYLTFAHLSAGTVKAKFYTKSGGSETVTLHSASAGQVNTYRMQMSTIFAASSYEPEGLYGLVDVWVENGGVQQSYVQRYVCTPETRDEHYFSCVNSLGGIDTFCFTGPQTLAPSVEHAAALRGDRKIDITPAPERSWTQNTGDLDKAESKWIWDFFNSSRHWAAIDGELEEIVIESSSVRASDAENLNAFDFAFSPVNTGRTMKIDRTSGQLPAMQVLSPTGDLFFLAPRIVDYPDATIDESLLLLTQSPLVQEWRKIGIGPLCDYLSDQIHNTSWGQLAHTHSNKAVIDALSEQGGKLLFNGQPVTPDIPQMPDHYIAGTKAKTAESDDALSRVTKISFTAATAASESVDLEVVTINGQRFLHTSLPFFSDSEITAGGVGSGETPGPATTLGALLNVDSEADDTPTTDKILVREAGSTHWTITDLADISGSVTGVRMNGSLMPISNKVVDLGSVATLGTDGKVPSSQLPSYVDDVLEFATLDDFPATGESGKIYIALDTNLTYRWGGSAYVPISQSLALGETESTAYRGDRGKTAYDHSQITSGNPHGTTFADLSGSLSFDKLPDIYVAGTKAKSSASDDALSRVTKISFTAASAASESVDLEVVTINGQRFLHTSLPFYSDNEITAGGVGSGGGGSTSTLATLLDVKHSSGNVIQRLSGGDVQTGDLFLKGDSTHWYALAKGNNGQILKMVNGLPSWGDAPATGVTSISVNSGAAQTGPVSLTIPTKTSDLTNDSGFITSSALSGYLPLSGGTLTGTLAVTNGLTINTETNGGIHINEGGSVNYGFDIIDSENQLQFRRRSGGSGGAAVFYVPRTESRVFFTEVPVVNGELLPSKSWINQQGFAYASALANYLPLTGGTLTGGLTMGSNSNPWIAFRKGSNSAAFLIYKGNADWYVSNESWANEYQLYHTGNLSGNRIASILGTEYVQNARYADRLTAGLPVIGNTPYFVGISPANNYMAYAVDRGAIVKLYLDGVEIIPTNDRFAKSLFDGTYGIDDFPFQLVNQSTYTSYNSSKSYSIGELCSYMPSGASKNMWYRCVRACSGVIPTNTSYWEDVSAPSSYPGVNPTKFSTLTIVVTNLPNNVAWENGLTLYWRSKEQRPSYVTVDKLDTDGIRYNVVTNYPLIGPADNIYLGLAASSSSQRGISLTFSGFTGNNYYAFSLSQIAFSGINGSLEQSVMFRSGGNVYGSITPYTNNSYNLGSTGNRWENVYASNVNASNIYASYIYTSGNLQVHGGFETSDIYPANSKLTFTVTNGSDTWSGGWIAPYIAANNGGIGGYPSGIAFYTKLADGYRSSLPTLKMVIDANGKVGIGTTSPSEKLHVAGNIVATGEITAGSASDARFKSNIEPLRNALAVLKSLRPVEFDWNGYYTYLGGRSAGHDIGFVAQEVQPLIPSAVSYIFGDHLRLDYAKLTPYLVSGWQSHEQRIATLEMENAELKRQLSTIKS